MKPVRVEIDGLDMLAKLGTDKIVHDLEEDEKICPTCHGVGIHKCESRYGLSEEPRKWDDPFPYRHQWLTPCHHCYMGKIKICMLCKGYLERSRTICECKEARDLRTAAANAKEAERREKLPRIKLEDYHLDMVWSDDCDEYVMVDGLDSHLEDRPDDVFFACTEAKAQIAPCATDVIDEIERMANEEVEDGHDRIVYKDGAKEALELVLEKWFEEYVEVPDVFWQNNNLIVEVPRGEPADE